MARLEQVHDGTPVDMPALNAAQQVAADAIGGAQGFTPLLLYGVTGSGKTEVYLQACAQVLAREDDAQILILVPEINLTPQLEGNIRTRFPGVMLATLHSSLSEGERGLHWIAAHQGRARIVLGTRLAILASLPNLKLIVIDAASEAEAISTAVRGGWRVLAVDDSGAADSAAVARPGKQGRVRRAWRWT